MKLKSHEGRSTRERGGKYDKSLGECEKTREMSEIFYSWERGRKSIIV
jgi:hypothetical protein